MKNKLVTMLLVGLTAVSMAGCIKTHPDSTVEDIFIDNGVKLSEKDRLDIVGSDGDVLLTRDVIEQDKSVEYGVYSKSSADVYNYLNEDFTYNREALGVTCEVGNHDFSGRWLYPGISKGYYDTLICDYRSDTNMGLLCYNGDSRDNMCISLGHYQFRYKLDDTALHFEKYDVTDEDGNPIEVYFTVEENKSRYICKFGPFTLELRHNDSEILSQEDVQNIVGNMRLR